LLMAVGSNEDLYGYHLRDSRYSITASPDTNRNPKNNRKRCMKAIIENTTMLIVVNGFTIFHLFPKAILPEVLS
jgi:hypothetical protein